MFGGVTCLPGCFSMYRLKARKDDEGDWFPVLVQPQIVSEYSQSVVTTLHQKNLLLLGEDRFLTTLLLRTFPNRKMMFCPYARCRTVVPDTFSVLLSQRRRWINSTIHNLMELVLVRNLCGTFCFSMQVSLNLDLLHWQRSLNFVSSTVCCPGRFTRHYRATDRYLSDRCDAHHLREYP